LQNKHEERELFDRIADRTENFESLSEKAFKQLLETLSMSGIKLEGEVLELGCGTGAFGRRLASRNYEIQVMGIDISPKMVNLANKLATDRFEAKVGDMNNPALFSPQTFDAVVACMSLHHLSDLSQVFKNIKYWLRNGGQLLFIEPNGSCPVNKLSKIIRRLLVLISGDYFVRHRSLFSIGETDHTIRTYMTFLNLHNFKIKMIKSFYGYYECMLPAMIKDAKRRMGLLSYADVRRLLWKTSYRLLPEPFGGGVIMVMARLRKNAKALCGDT